jgi:hypothetical protein
LDGFVSLQCLQEIAVGMIHDHVCVCVHVEGATSGPYPYGRNEIGEALVLASLLGSAPDVKAQHVHLAGRLPGNADHRRLRDGLKGDQGHGGPGDSRGHGQQKDEQPDAAQNRPDPVSV